MSDLDKGRLVELLRARVAFRGHWYRWRYRDMFWTGGDPLSWSVVFTWLGFQWGKL